MSDTFEKFNTVQCRISESLYNEIKDSQIILNETEMKKKSGFKKKKWTFQEASHRIGLRLQKQRKNSSLNEKV